LDKLLHKFTQTHNERCSQSMLT